MKNLKTTSIFYFLDSRFSNKGFTLIEVVISVAIITLLTVAAIVILDPARQFAKSRNTQRWSDVNVILNAVGQNTVDNRGTFSCSSGGIPTTTTRMASSSPNYNIAPCLVATYLSALPFDPATSGAKWTSVTDYDTAYNILRNATTGRVTISAPAAELGESVTVTR
ncbi:MAG: prepilin-type N-terminal cleavage/methylation domain-containing protein [Candidatus Liptonbacteria bacterium]|nr:prepilin-type N-terminal cleavage/methylation domain-containing protein [Candidatus Liptonbacteria bacterium]